MAGNFIIGTIPGEIFLLNQLSELHLSSNLIVGSIPPQIEKASGLSLLYLSGNRLRGPIPYQIGGCYNLHFLDLSTNNFSGIMPFELRNLPRLVLSYNSLSGGIPSNLGKLTRLESLNMSHNNLLGFIPYSLSIILYLTSLNLSYNNLEGPVPDGGIFSSSHPVDLKNNSKLCGKFQGLQPCNGSRHHGGSKNNGVVRSIVISLACILLVLSIGSVTILHIKNRNHVDLTPNEASNLQNQFSIWHFNGSAVYQEIIDATEDFDDSYCIGEGAFAKVYGYCSQGMHTLIF